MDGMFFQERKLIAQLAASARLPAVYGFRQHVDGGGLISYVVNLAGNFRRAATYVVKILKGAKPGDLAVEFPNKLKLIINLKTSKALGGRSFAVIGSSFLRGILELCTPGQAISFVSTTGTLTACIESTKPRSGMRSCAGHYPIACSLPVVLAIFWPSLSSNDMARPH